MDFTDGNKKENCSFHSSYESWSEAQRKRVQTNQYLQPTPNPNDSNSMERRLLMV